MDVEVKVLASLVDFDRVAHDVLWCYIHQLRSDLEN